MGWKPINTAPADTPVRIGGYQELDSDLVWYEGVDIPFRSAFFGLYKKRDPRLPNWVTHWTHAPTPPEGTE